MMYYLAHVPSITQTIKITFKIGEHDLDVKKNQASKFAKAGHPLKVVLFLRWRENQYENIAREKIESFIVMLEDFYKIDKKLVKNQKAHKLDILSKKAANKSTQPVFTTKNKGGYSDGDGVRVTTSEEVITKKDVILIEEFDKIKNLMSYNRKTQ